MQFYLLKINHIKINFFSIGIHKYFKLIQIILKKYADECLKIKKGFNHPE